MAARLDVTNTWGADSETQRAFIMRSHARQQGTFISEQGGAVLSFESNGRFDCLSLLLDSLACCCYWISRCIESQSVRRKKPSCVSSFSSSDLACNKCVHVGPEKQRKNVGKKLFHPDGDRTINVRFDDSLNGKGFWSLACKWHHGNAWPALNKK